jgi:hypothetical protein
MKTATSLGASGGWRVVAALVAAMTVGLFGVLLIASGPAQAHDHRIPGTVLKKGAKGLQAGLLVNESSWDRPSGDNQCVNINTFYRTRFPEADAVAAGAKLRVRVFKAQRPALFSVRAYRAVDEDGELRGREEALSSTLERVVRNGETVAWDVWFSVDRPNRDYYLIGEGHWQDREGCGNDQFAHWSFHVNTDRPAVRP